VELNEIIKTWQEVNILIGDISEKDRELFFGPNADKEPFITMIDSNIKWPQLLRGLGFFRSASEAKKNGWDKDIPESFTDVVIGKKKRRITILKAGEWQNE